MTRGEWTCSECGVRLSEAPSAWPPYRDDVRNGHWARRWLGMSIAARSVLEYCGPVRPIDDHVLRMEHLTGERML